MRESVLPFSGIFTIYDINSQCIIGFDTVNKNVFPQKTCIVYHYLL